ncbi:MAG TPA: inositol monophosphatase family protein [Steroidobacteraceae bacterium]|jgi:histidinol-phosphatase
MASKELQAALDAARAAAEVIQGFYRRNLAVRIKADKSPVTEADVRAEQVIYELLHARFPDYGFYGEETGRHAPDADNIWLVDPIDGTKSFVRDSPFFSTQIALMRAGQLVLGVSCASAYGELAWAEQGGGAFLDGAPIRVSGIGDVGEAFLSIGNFKSLTTSRSSWERFGALATRVSRLRGYGDFLHYHLLARGALDIVLESDINILDIAALTVLVREAGGRVTDLSGADIGLHSTTILATNGALHEPVLAAMRQ